MQSFHQTVFMGRDSPTIFNLLHTLDTLFISWADKYANFLLLKKM